MKTDNSNSYIVATIKPWNIEVYHRYSPDLPGDWFLATSPDELDELLERVSPRYIFFPHWSWLVSDELTARYECVCFHMTDVPYGRGGSPLQNLLQRGHATTKLTALKMTSVLDAGPVYKKIEVPLLGSAQSIYEDMAEKVYELISFIVETEVIPSEQEGEIVYFERKKPEQSVLPKTGELDSIYNHIRMLDAETYPKAFIKHGDFILEFYDAQYEEGKLVCKVEFKKDKR